jgi:serine/threonine protein kinase
MISVKSLIFLLYKIQIEIGKLLGEGGFGKVYYGQRISGAIPNQVALKSTQYNNKEDDFKKEILLLEQMDHLYVVKFYGLYVIESVT